MTFSITGITKTLYKRVVGYYQHASIRPTYTKIDYICNIIHIFDPMTVSFSGHRPEKIKNFSLIKELSIRDALHASIKKAYMAGYKNFLSGMAPGFDLWAADEVLKLRLQEGLNDIILVAVIPFPRFRNSFDDASATLYDHIMEQADKSMIIANNYHFSIYSRRNDYLIDNSSLLICYYEGHSGGTRYTVKKATSKKMDVINLFAPELFCQQTLP